MKDVDILQNIWKLNFKIILSFNLWNFYTYIECILILYNSPLPTKLTPLQIHAFFLKLLLLWIVTKDKVFTIRTWVQDELFMNFTTYVYAHIYVCLYMFICIYADAVYVYKIRLRVCMYVYVYRSIEESSGRALISFDLFWTWSSLPVYSEKLGMKRTPMYLNQTSVYTTEQSTSLY